MLPLAQSTMATPERTQVGRLISGTIDGPRSCYCHQQGGNGNHPARIQFIVCQLGFDRQVSCCWKWNCIARHIVTRHEINDTAIKRNGEGITYAAIAEQPKRSEYGFCCGATGLLRRRMYIISCRKIIPNWKGYNRTPPWSWLRTAHRICRSAGWYRHRPGQWGG